MYYPKSQIKTNLFTNGDEYENTFGVPYVGQYWKSSDGKIHSGVGPQDRNSFILVPITLSKTVDSNFNIKTNTTDLSPEVLGYFKAKKIDINNPPTYKTPSYTLNRPTDEDYINEFYVRYFTKQTNRNVYLEISEDTYNDLKSLNPDYEFNLYDTFKINWVISGGDEEYIAEQNYNLVEYYEEKLNYPGFLNYFSNYAEFYKP